MTRTPPPDDRPPPRDEIPEPAEELTVDEVKSRAVRGTAILGTRSAVVFGLGVVANLVLARLLVPDDFGLVALGTTIITLVRFVSESGLGAAFIRRREPPERSELQALFGLQLAISVAVVLAFTAGALPFGRDGLVPALMLVALPLSSPRLPTALVLERDLSYRAIARAEVLEAVSGYVWAIATVAAGFGVWGLASAAPVRVLVGTVALIRLGPLGFVTPRWAWSRIRPIIGFGVRFQAVNVVGAVRDQGLNIGIAAVGGIATLGIWSFAYRIMQVPVLLYMSLWRVSYPALSRLLDAGQGPRHVIERTIGAVAVAMSPICVGIVAGAHALPPIVGERWSDSIGILFWGSAATMVNAPVSVPCEGYLFAAGRVSKVLLAAVVGAVLWPGLALLLLDPLGPDAIGIGWFAMALAEAVMLGWWVQRELGVRVLSSLFRPLAVAIVAGAVGLFVATRGDEGVLLGVAAVVAAELVLAAGMYALARDTVRATLRLSGRVGRG